MKVLFSILLTITCSTLVAQNMVINSGFDELDSIGTWPINWKKVNTVDFFHTENSMKYKRTEFWPDEYIRQPKGGKGFIGLWNRDEVIIGEMHPLKADTWYRIEMWVSTMDGQTPTSTFWVGVSKRIKIVKDHKLYFNLPKHFQNKPDNFITNTKEWVKVEGYFKANGNERNIAISCISKTPQYIDGKVPTKGSYLFFDEISIVEKKPPLVLTENEPLRLENIFFETGKAKLLSNSFAELNLLSKELKKFPNKKLEISGHTDNTGNTEQNQKLSEARAKAVMNYLVRKGIDNKRLKFIGYGSTKPVSSNETASGRKQNRRVEVKLTD